MKNSHYRGDGVYKTDAREKRTREPEEVRGHRVGDHVVYSPNGDRGVVTGRIVRVEGPGQDRSQGTGGERLQRNQGFVHVRDESGQKHVVKAEDWNLRNPAKMQREAAGAAAKKNSFEERMSKAATKVAKSSSEEAKQATRDADGNGAVRHNVAAMAHQRAADDHEQAATKARARGDAETAAKHSDMAINHRDVAAAHHERDSERAISIVSNMEWDESKHPRDAQGKFS